MEGTVEPYCFHGACERLGVDGTGDGFVASANDEASNLLERLGGGGNVLRRRRGRHAEHSLRSQCEQKGSKLNKLLIENWALRSTPFRHSLPKSICSIVSFVEVVGGCAVGFASSESPRTWTRVDHCTCQLFPMKTMESMRTVTRCTPALNSSVMTAPFQFDDA